MQFLYKTLERKKIKVWTLVRKLSRLNSYRNPAGDKEPIWKCLTKPPQRKEACFETKWRKTHTPTLTQIPEQFFGLQLLWWDQVWHEFRSGVRECFFLFLLQSPEDLLLAFRTFLHLQVFFFLLWLNSFDDFVNSRVLFCPHHLVCFTPINPLEL